MAEKPDPKDYAYCKEHDIFFNQQFVQKAEKENEDLKKAGLFARAEACPICKQNIVLMVLSMGASREPSQRERMMEEPRIKRGRGEQKQYIWLNKTPPETPAKIRTKKNARG